MDPDYRHNLPVVARGLFRGVLRDGRPASADGLWSTMGLIARRVRCTLPAERNGESWHRHRSACV